MDRDQVIRVLESLTTTTDASVLQNADTAKAIYAACAVLRGAPSPTFASAGAAWSKEEDEQLLREHDSGMSVAQIALKHKRTSGGIASRLVKLGRIPPPVVKGARQQSIA